jgi:hypothetical protein
MTTTRALAGAAMLLLPFFAACSHADLTSPDAAPAKVFLSESSAPCNLSTEEQGQATTLTANFQAQQAARQKTIDRLEHELIFERNRANTAAVNQLTTYIAKLRAQSAAAKAQYDAAMAALCA